MAIRLTLQPGQAGTKKLVEEYGDRMVCARYRYDAEKCKRYKTVELIVEESPWAPQSTPSSGRRPDGRRSWKSGDDFATTD